MERTVNTARARLGIRIAAALLLGIGVAAAPALTYAQHAGGGPWAAATWAAAAVAAHASGGAHLAVSAGPRWRPHFGGAHVARPIHGGAYRLALDLSAPRAT